MKRLPFIIALLCLVSTTLAAGSEHPLKARYNIDPTPEAIRAFLTTLDRSTMTRQQYASLLDQLGHESYDKREQASQSLRLAHQNGVYFADLMKQALKSPDAEIQIRAEMLVEHRKKLNPNEMATKTLIAVLGVIDEEHFKGFTELLVSTAPRVHDEAAQLALIHTLISVTDPTDIKAVATIGKAMTHESAAVRRMAAEAMIGLLGEKANDRIAPLLGDDDSAVRFIAAKHLIETGDRRALRMLIDMAADPNATLQHNSIALLRAVTGQQFGYDASKEPEANAESIQRWQAWHAEHGATAKLNAPLGPDSVDSTGLVLHYVFKGDELAKDRSGQGNDGSGKNVKLVGGSPRGGGLKVNAAASYVTVPNKASLEIHGPITLAAWVKFDGWAKGPYGQEEGYVIKKGDPMWWTPAYALGLAKNARLARFALGRQSTGDRSGLRLAGRTRLKLSEWYHIAGTYDGKCGKIYVNGRLENTVPHTGALRKDNANVLLNGGRLGSVNGHGNHFTTTGIIDDVRIYNRALTDVEINWLSRR